jgi:thiamine-monophosphate kinase
MTTCADLGEKGILARILPIMATTRHGRAAPAVVDPATVDPATVDPATADPAAGTAAVLEIGPGDDAASVTLPSAQLVISTDMMIEGEDFLLGFSDPVDIGWKSAVQNLADIAAMGAVADVLVVSLAVPGSQDVAVVEGIAEGLAGAADRWGAVVAGGDLSAGPQIVLSVAVTGHLEEGEQPVLRSGARPGDVVAVSGDYLGGAAAGLALLFAGRDDLALRLAADPELVRRQLRQDPDPRAGRRARAGGAHAMMDVSDGLVRDGRRIASASGVVLELDRAALARDAERVATAAQMLGVDPLDWVLHSGEEHVMLAAFPPEAVLPPGFRAIGTVREPAPGQEPDVLLDGALVPGRGWDHFG